MEKCLQLATEMLARYNIPQPEQIIADGKRHRFDSNGKLKRDGSHWYHITPEDGRVNIGSFSRLAGGSVTEFIKSDIKRTPEEIAQIRAQQEKARIKREKQEAIEKAEAKQKVQELWAKGHDVKENNPYLKAKQIKPIGGIKQLGKMLLIPLWVNKELVNLQFIVLGEKKKFKTHARKKGAFFILGNAKAKRLIVCEGYATGASIHQATGETVIVAFDAGNLYPVCKHILDKAPEKNLFIACDDDRHKKFNTGLVKARELAARLPVKLIIPTFTSTQDNPTDFNDLHCMEGLNEVKRQIMTAIQTHQQQQKKEAKEQHQAPQPKSQKNSKREVLARLLNIVEPVDFYRVCQSLGWQPTKNKSGAENPPLQKHYKVAIIDQLLKVAKRNNWHLIRDEGASYVYTGSMWLPLEQDELKNFLKDVAIKQGYPEIEARDNKFINLLYDQALQDGFFMDRTLKKQSMINLNNCTLVLSSKGVTVKDFDHRDFLTHQLDFDLDPNAVNERFNQYLDEVLPNKDTQRTLQEVCGYLFVKGLKLEKAIFLYGEGANGKSVLFEALNGIIGADNISNFSLESLTDEKGYHRAKIKDKIVNYGTDIKLNKIDPDKFKTMASGEPIEARHPYEQPFIMEDYAKLIFNINRLDNANIEHTHGFYRRFLVIPFNQTIAEEKQDKSLHKKILKNKAGVLNWIIEGAKRVIANENIFISDECKKFKQRFIEESDNVALFLEDRAYSQDDNTRTYLRELYEEYRVFCTEDGYRALSKTNFKKRLEALGYKTGKYQNLIFLRMKKTVTISKPMMASNAY